MKMASSDPAKEHPLILRLPKDCADKVRDIIRADSLGERLQLEFNKDPLGTMRYCRVKLDDELLSAKLVDLPCIIESCKTLDRRSLLKTGDISQMVICSRDPPEEESKEEKIDEMTAAKKKELYKKFVWNHGITPPLKNVRKRRFRKTKTKKMIECPEVEKEVKRLLRADTFAVNVSFKVVNEEDKRNDDSQSIASDYTSFTNQSQLLQEEDSLLSNPTSYQHLSNDKEELLRMLEEASCSSSSSSSEESEDEEISVVEQSESEEVSMLRLAIQDLENQIEEQKFKIQNTPMPLLRDRFETFLTELEKQKKDKMDELEQLLK